MVIRASLALLAVACCLAVAADVQEAHRATDLGSDALNVEADNQHSKDAPWGGFDKAPVSVTLTLPDATTVTVDMRKHPQAGGNLPQGAVIGRVELADEVPELGESAQIRWEASGPVRGLSGKLARSKTSSRVILIKGMHGEDDLGEEGSMGCRRGQSLVNFNFYRRKNCQQLVRSVSRCAECVPSQDAQRCWMNTDFVYKVKGADLRYGLWVKPTLGNSVMLGVAAQIEGSNSFLISKAPRHRRRQSFGIHDCQTLCDSSFSVAVVNAMVRNIPWQYRREARQDITRELCNPKQWRRRHGGSHKWKFRQCDKRNDDCPDTDDFDDEEEDALIAEDI